MLCSRCVAKHMCAANQHRWMRACRAVSEPVAPPDDYVACHKSACRHRRRHRLLCTAELGSANRTARLDVMWLRVHRVCATQAWPRQPCAGCVCTQLGSHGHHVSQQNASFCCFPPRLSRKGGGGGTHCKWAARWAPSAAHRMYEHPSSPCHDTGWGITTTGGGGSNLGKGPPPLSHTQIDGENPKENKQALYQPPGPCSLGLQSLPLRTAGDTKSC